MLPSATPVTVRPPTFTWLFAVTTLFAPSATEFLKPPSDACSPSASE
jgi:hypothetical protein